MEKISANITRAQGTKQASSPAMRNANGWSPFFSAIVQPKLTINQPGDAHEQEADAMADKVMRMSDKNMEQGFFKPATPNIQRKCRHCEEEEKKMQRKESNAEPVSQKTATHNTENYINSLNGGGRSLTLGERQFFEPRFGHDFSDVQLHTDTAANNSAKEVNALAYTAGNNIVFGRGQYQPGTNDGKRLMAHELTHVVQKKSAPATNKLVQRRAGEEPDEIHGPLLDEYARETGQPRAGVTQQDPAFQAWLSARVAAGTIAPVIDASCTNRQMVINTVQEALRWVDDIYAQLNNFEADVIFGNHSPDYPRIASALQQTFHTTEWSYVQVIASRFYHIGAMLREANRVTIFCGGSGCSSAGSSTVAAFVNTPYQIHICGSNPNIGVFIHEMGHAVIPSIGIRNTVTPSGGLNDRAYTHERAFHHLSPEESLDNAEAYGALADALHNRRTGSIVPAQPDTVTGACPDNTMPLAAIARAELAVRWGWRMLEAWLRELHGVSSGGQPLTGLPQSDQDFITANLPWVTSTADLRTLYQSFTSLYTSGFHGVNAGFQCIGNATRCANNIVGIAVAGKVTSSAIIMGANNPTGMIDLCNSWFALAERDRIRTSFALYLLGLGSGATGSLNQADGFRLIDFALAVEQQQMPAPTTHSALEHMFADQPTAPLAGNTPHL